MSNGIISIDADEGDGSWLRNVGLWPIIEAAGRARKIHRTVDSSSQARSQNCEKRILASPCLSLRFSAWNNSGPNGRIFFKFVTRKVFENPST